MRALQAGGAIFMKNEQESPLFVKSRLLSERIRTIVHAKWWIEIDRDILRQVLRSGTSVGANYREAWFAESRNDFAHKLKIVRKEANETLYWLEVLSQSPRSHNCTDLEFAQKLAREIVYLTTASITSVGKKQSKPPQ